MRGDENADILLVVVLERFGVVGLFSQLMHMGNGDSFHFMESYSVCGYSIGGYADGVGYTEPVAQVGVRRKELAFGKQRIGIIAHESVQFTTGDCRAEYGLHLLGGFRLSSSGTRTFQSLARISVALRWNPCAQS